MKDYKTKRAYQIVYKDLKKRCKQYANCSDCPIQKICDHNNEMICETIRTTKEILFGKDEEK